VRLGAAQLSSEEASRGDAPVLRASRRRRQPRRLASGEEVDEEARGEDEGGRWRRVRSAMWLAAGAVVDGS
jgi:hypothetical protein